MTPAEDTILVLCVDDDQAFVDLTATFLERERDAFSVVTETRAADGLDRLDDESVDCVVSDYDMPGVDGLEFLEAVRERDADLPFLLFTGKGSEEIASEAISAGVTDYLQKGTGTDKYVVLANRIENAVESYNVRQSLERRELLFEAVFNDPHAFIGILDPDGTLLNANRTALEFVGVDLSDVVGEPFWELSWWDHSETLQSECRSWIRRAADGEYVDYEAAHYGDDGERVVIDGTVRPVTNDGAVVNVIVEGRNLPSAEMGAGSDSSPDASAPDSSSDPSETVTETVTETQTESETAVTEDDN